MEGGGPEIKQQTKGEENRQSQFPSGYKLNRILKISQTLIWSYDKTETQDNIQDKQTTDACQEMQNTFCYLVAFQKGIVPQHLRFTRKVSLSNLCIT